MLKVEHCTGNLELSFITEIHTSKLDLTPAGKLILNVHVPVFFLFMSVEKLMRKDPRSLQRPSMGSTAFGVSTAFNGFHCDPFASTPHAEHSTFHHFSFYGFWCDWLRPALKKTMRKDDH